MATNLGGNWSGGLRARIWQAFKEENMGQLEEQNSNKEATFVRGYYGSKERPGARSKLTKQRMKSVKSSQVADKNITFGLPAKIYGRPLGCGCRVAYLSSVGEVNENGEVEANYKCDSRWDNYVVFQVIAKKKTVKKEKAVKLDKNGQVKIGGDDDFKAQDLEEL
jgi:hypothetical protein